VPDLKAAVPLSQSRDVDMRYKYNQILRFNRSPRGFEGPTGKCHANAAPIDHDHLPRIFGNAAKDRRIIRTNLRSRWEDDRVRCTAQKSSGLLPLAI
jgi:hypothetical protein